MKGKRDRLDVLPILLDQRSSIAPQLDVSSEYLFLLVLFLLVTGTSRPPLTFPLRKEVEEPIHHQPEIIPPPTEEPRSTRDYRPGHRYGWDIIRRG